VGDQGVFHALDGGPFTSEDAGWTNALSVWGSGAHDVYVGTAGAPAAVLHSAGDGNWQAVYAQGGDAAWAVWSSGSGNAYALLAPAGTANPATRLVHAVPDGGWNDESFSPTPTTLVALWGSGAGDVYAGGWHADAAAGRAGDLFHSTGTGRWIRVSLPGKLYDVRCIWGNSADDVYVGAYDVNDGPVLLHGQR
jgi:hypothetical protein